MKKLYSIVTLKGEDGGYIATVPELPGVVAQGSSEEELETRIVEALKVYMDTLEREKLEVPQSLELVSVSQVEVDHG